jgi:hypothetical protein
LRIVIDELAFHERLVPAYKTYRGMGGCLSTASQNLNTVISAESQPYIGR